MSMYSVDDNNVRISEHEVLMIIIVEIPDF
jgi:hypothetical protein